MGGRGYNDGTNSLEGQAFIDEFLSPRNMTIRESDEVVLVLMKSDEVDLIVEEIIMGDQKKVNPTITLEDRVAFWWIKASGRIVIDLDLASKLLGKEYNVFDFLVNVASTVGRAFTLGNTLTITSELVGIESELQDAPDAPPVTR
jgi:methane monooxygenase regulatory protein B